MQHTCVYVDMAISIICSVIHLFFIYNTQFLRWNLDIR